MNISRTRASAAWAVEQIEKARQKVYTAKPEELAGILNAAWHYADAVRSDLIEQEKKNG